MALRTKPLLIILIVLALLYVLISPLPELAATKSGGCVALPAPFLLCFILAIIALLLPLFSQQPAISRSVSRSLLCNMLC